MDIHSMPRREPDAIAPDGSEIYLLVSQAQRASLVEVDLPAGEISRPVKHRTVEEIWYVLHGTGEMWLRDPDLGESVIHPIAPGTSIVIPTGHHFQFRSNGPAELRILCYTSPPWPGADEAVAVDEGAWSPTVGTAEPS